VRQGLHNLRDAGFSQPLRCVLKYVEMCFKVFASAGRLFAQVKREAKPSAGI